jgi:hypothetical protein
MVLLGVNFVDRRDETVARVRQKILIAESTVLLNPPCFVVVPLGIDFAL